MPDLQIEQWPVQKLRPYEHNPRKNDHVVNRMVDALRQFGFRVPLLAKSDGELIDGHLRYKAALAMGMETVPVICADDMDDTRIRAFRIQGEALAIEELPTSIIDVPRPAKSELHPTMKPVALIEKMLANSSPRGGIVGDFFGGSGSTLMACERLGRSARLMELDPRFVDVIIRRWQEYSGSDAVREADGKTYGELEAENVVAQ